MVNTHDKALAATREYFKQINNSPTKLNDFPLGIDEKLYKLTEPGLGFRETSGIDHEGTIIHNISVITFAYIIDEESDVNIYKFTVLNDSLHSYEFKFTDVWLYDGESIDAKIDYAISELLKRVRLNSDDEYAGGFR